MSAIILDGIKIANQIKAEVAEEVRELSAAGLRPGLAESQQPRVPSRY